MAELGAPVIPVSWGELFDRIAILAIKTNRLRDPNAAANAARELAALQQLAACSASISELCHALVAVNTRLWRAEDQIREKERSHDFGSDFVALSRAIYFDNDERGRIKFSLNQILRSSLVEEKQYATY